MTSHTLVLRPFLASDADALHGYLSRPEAVRYEPYDPLDAHTCAQLAAERADDDRFVAVCLPDGTLVGNLYRAPDGPPAWRTWEIGFVFHPDHWGNGYATRAVRLLLEDLFTARGAHRVVARCDPRNAPSWRLLERVGMRREGHLVRAATFRDDEQGRPVWHDVFEYALLEGEPRG